MASSDTIDAQFHRAVDIVQSLPKGGPVQTSYEEKLWLYSLYKQEGDITVPRPGLLDMLGRAKWDSWNKQKGSEKVDAKMRYVTALIRILRKHAQSESGKKYIAELEAYYPDETPGSPASSSSSFHSSRASPLSPAQPLYPPPDPSLPPPDISPEYIPPSALNASHKSLLSLHQPPVSVSQQAEYAESLDAPIPGAYAAHQAHPSQVDSRAHSLVGGGRGKESTHSFRHRQQPPTPSALGFVPDQAGPGPSHPLASSSRPYSPFIPGPPIHRDYAGTPELLGNSPYLGMGIGQNAQYPRPGSTSTFAAAPLNLPYTLQQIQTSLTALHERMTTLERTQAIILRRDDRRKGWFWSSREEEDLDEVEDQQDRVRYGNTATTTSRRKRQGPLSLRAVWFLLRLARRAMVDLGVGMLVTLVAAIIMGGGWRRARLTLSNTIARARQIIASAL